MVKGSLVLTQGTLIRNCQAMFTDRDAVSGAEFPSCWKMELSLSESGCQTMPSTTAETSCQVGDRVEAECQTEDGEEEE